MKVSDRATAEGILFTDQYQLSMAHLYYRMGMHETQAQFDHFFRSYPDYGLHEAGYCINAGLEWLVDWMQEVHCRDEDIEYLRSQKGRTGDPVFEEDFLKWLRKNGDFSGINMRAIPEGRVVHPNVPLTVVHGPMAMAQILETPLLNHLNFPTLIATKAARIREVCGDAVVLEFGLRRAQDKAANAGARATLIGGADFTSNTGISHVLGFPPKGTHAHSMVQAFMALGEGEIGAFRAYADVYPDDCLLLVDTIDTLESGVPNAIKVFEELKKKGHDPVGIRLDSGDLAYLSMRSAKMLDDAGFPHTTIVLSNQLDEFVIWQILEQIRDEANRYGIDAGNVIGRLVYGVGTHLITSEGDASLDGVYKLVAVHDDDRWTPAIKISETPAKTINPGHKHVWRLYDRQNNAVADLLSLYEENPADMQQIEMRPAAEWGERETLERNNLSEIEPVLVDILKEGQIVYDFPSIEEMRKQRIADTDRLDSDVKRLMEPHTYTVSLTEQLWELKKELVESIKEGM